MQRRLWFLDQLDAGSGLNVHAAAELVGNLDRERLMGAIDEFVQRHDLLRAHFVDGDNGLATAEMDAAPRVEFSDLAGAPNVDLQVEEQLTQQRDKPFDLTTGPLFRALLLRVADARHVLSICAHHTVWDNGSNRIFLEELRALYLETTLPLVAETSATPQYADYAAQQSSDSIDPSETAEGRFWIERLQSLSPINFARPQLRPPVKGFGTSAIEFSLNDNSAAQLRMHARAARCSLSSILCAAFQATLARWSNNDDIAVGLLVSHRQRPAYARIVGPCVNLCVVRSTLGGGMEFLGEIVQCVHSAILDAIENPYVPFEWLARELDAGRDRSRHPLCDAMFSFVDQPSPATPMGAVQLSPYYATPWGRDYIDHNSPSTAADLDLRWVERDASLFGRLIFDEDVIDSGLAARFVHSMRRVIDAIVERPALTLAKLPVCDGADLQKLRQWSNGPQIASEPQSVVDAFRNVAATRANARALTDPGRGRTLTFAELCKRADDVATRLLALGVARGTHVGVSIPRSAESVVATLGVLRAGAAFVPLDPNHPRAHRANILQQATTQLVLVGRDLDDAEPVAGEQLLVVDLDSPLVEPGGIEFPELLTTDTAYVLFTSGSTGIPKGVVGLHAGLANRVRWEHRVAPFGADSVACHKSNPVFADAIAEVFAPLCAGAPIVVASEEVASDPLELATFLTQHVVTRVVMVPTLLKAILEASSPSRAQLPHLRRLTLSGEPLYWELVERLNKVAPQLQVVNVYGTTEVSADATAFIASGCSDHGEVHGAVPIGSPLDNVVTRVVDRFGSDVPVGALGELWIGGPGIAAGYCNSPEDSKQRFISAPTPTGNIARFFRTGDLARWSMDGQLLFEGRIDSQINRLGVRIEPGEIERALERHESVSECAVAIRQHRGVDVLVAFYTTSPAAIAEATALHDWLAEQLPSTQLPAHVIEVDRLPHTPSGKLDRKRLPIELALELTDSATEAAFTPAERMLIDVWRDVLGLDSVARHDRFPELGGHSLAALTVTRRIEEQTGVRLAPMDMLMADLAQLARKLEEGLAEVAELTTGGNRPKTRSKITRAAMRLLSIMAGKSKQTTQ